MAVTIQDALNKAVKAIEKTEAFTPLLDAEVLLCHTLHTDRLFLILHRDKELTQEQVDYFHGLIQKRLKGVPVPYLTKRQEFMGLDFYVAEGVLIPRPDTEILVETVIRIAKSINTKSILQIVDIGTGSGAISVSLATYIPNVLIYAIDLSYKALEIAKKNAKANQVSDKIIFLQGDLLRPLAQKQLQYRIDILVSNPPYIPSREIDGLQVEIAEYEPRLALDGGEDGFDYYRRIIDQSRTYLKQGGWIAFEMGYDQGKQIEKTMEAERIYNHIERVKDLSGKERVIIGKRGH